MAMANCLRFSCFLLLFLIFYVESREILINKRNINNRPIIGILSEEVTGSLLENYGYHLGYISAAYVKDLEAAGARVVPIMVNKDEAYYKKMVDSINGVLFPGGAVYFNNTHGYAWAGKIIYDYAKELNLQGDFFPIWGTCLGFELLAYIANNGNEIRVDCSSSNQILPLVFKPEYLESRLFSEAPEDILTILTTQNSTANFHRYCVTEEDINTQLHREWRVMSLNHDKNGLEFVSSFEHKELPFYGIQFHPEKLAYEWKPTHLTPHTADTIRASRYFADFFVNQARRNLHTFANENEERDALIYNYQPMFAKPDSSFTQIYFFDEDENC